METDRSLHSIFIQHSITPILHYSRKELKFFQLEFPRLGFSLVIAGFLVSSHRIQPVKFLEAVVNQCPDTVFVHINFTFSVVGSAAGPVDQTLVTVRHRADTAGFTDNAGAALSADLIK
jgi:hypothetical protein